ncbi:DUF7504 family protein [Haloglomus litoreum]|uniref:DUF7504 family protein n=1 Tax=Haloglomus litoreum TaxID=3034026 RepID=UPI0023E884AD|nr:DICT sensory domain-containing protein [Haloglomus sp. DT116]
MEYDTRNVFPVDALAAGESVLGTGPPLVGEQAVGNRFLARGLDAGEGAILVATTGSPDQVRERVALHTERADAPFAVVTTNDASFETSGDDLSWQVSSPADLTGIGIAITEAIETVTGRGTDGFRLVVDSLAPLTVYSEFERVYRFLHVALGRVATAQGVSFCYLPSDTVGNRAGTLRGLLTGVLEFREGERGPEYRMEGFPTAPEDWRPVPGGAEYGGSSGTSGERDLAGVENGDPGPSVAASAAELPASLGALIDRLAEERQVLTLFNYGGDEALFERLEAYFSRLNVTVRAADTSVEAPLNTAVLHRGTEPVDMAPVAVLDRAIRIEDADDAEAFDVTERPSLLRRAENDVYRVDDDGKGFLIDISRLVEQQALDVGRGTLYTGFQTLDRITDEYGTGRIYERLADSAVTVHLYGASGTVPTPTEHHHHVEPDGELADVWFVVFDGAGEDARKVALVCEETDPGRYRGFWTRRPALVDETVAYLQETYPVPGPTPSD